MSEEKLTTEKKDTLLKDLNDNLQGVIDAGLTTDSKVTEMLNKIKANDEKPDDDEQEKNLNSEILSAIKIGNDRQKELVNQFSLLNKPTSINGIFLNALQQENPKMDISDKNRAMNYAFGRYAQCLMNNYFANKGEREFSEADKKYLNTVNSTATDGAGAYTLQTEVLNTIFDDLAKVGYFFSETTEIPFYPGGGKTKQIPTVAAGSDPSASIAQVDEDAAKPIGNYTFTQIDLTLIKYAVIVPFTKEFEMYSPLDLASTIKRFAMEYFGIVFDNIFFNGDSDINGLQDFSTTNATITGTQMSGLTVNDLLDAIGGMRSVDLVGAKWAWHPTCWAKLYQKYDEAGRREFPLGDINSRTLLGFPVIVSDYMQAFVSGASASTDFGYFGNFKKVFRGQFDGLGISFSDQASYVSGETTVHMWQKNEMGYRLEMFVDLDCAFPSRITAIKTAAA